MGFWGKKIQKKNRDFNTFPFLLKDFYRTGDIALLPWAWKQKYISKPQSVQGTANQQ